MRFSRVNLVGAALPVAAILSLACGPSPSAAYAQADKCRIRSHSSKRAGEPARTTHGKSHGPVEEGTSPLIQKPPAPPKPRKPQADSSFVAPSSAKPSEGKVAELALALAVGNGPISPIRSLPDPAIGDRPALRPVLHRATYLALAPPAA
jgi:hypothetical protein